MYIVLFPCAFCEGIIPALHARDVKSERCEMIEVQIVVKEAPNLRIFFLCPELAGGLILDLKDSYGKYANEIFDRFRE